MLPERGQAHGQTVGVTHGGDEAENHRSAGGATDEAGKTDSEIQTTRIGRASPGAKAKLGGTKRHHPADTISTIGCSRVRTRYTADRSSLSCDELGGCCGSVPDEKIVDRLIS